MYHSWTTFALLLWALILWMVPNKGAMMMKCSPFIAFYSMLLVIVQYVYSMDLTEEELPTQINGIKVSEIGFIKTDQLSCWHLVVKVKKKKKEIISKFIYNLIYIKRASSCIFKTFQQLIFSVCSYRYSGLP